jgi:predicted nucleotide-binding protein (sugar kinase/HSP70/actin superfamily)
MANIVRLVPKVRTEELTKYASHTGDIYVFEMESEDRSKSIEFVWATAPTTSNFNAMPIGSLLFNVAASGLGYYKQAAATWVELGDLT